MSTWASNALLRPDIHLNTVGRLCTMTDYGGKVRGMRDVSDAFTTACQGLASGQLVRVKDLTMLDAMNSLTLLDPRMDTGCLVDVPGPSNADPICNFDLWARLLPEEVCAIMDKLTACEISYQSGRTLVSTMFPSMHLLSLSSLRDPPPELQANQLLTLVLRAYLLSLYLCLNLTWHELIRGNVYDGEDFMSDCHGMWEPGREWGVHLGEEVDDVVDMVRESVEWLEGESGLAKVVVGHLVARLRLRESTMMHLMMLLSGEGYAAWIPPHPPLRPFLTALETLPPLPEEIYVSPRVTSAFDWTIARRFRQVMPVAAADILTQQETMRYVEDLVDGLEMCRHLAYEEDLLGWDRVLRVLSLSHRPVLPIVRSGIMATLNPTPQTVSLGNGYPTAWIADEWLRTEAGLAPGRLPGLALRFDVTDPGAAKGLRGFLDQLAGHLINDYSIMCQNRARQRRLTLSSAVKWEEIYLMCPGPTALTPALHQAIREAIARHRLDIMLEGTLAGLDLELIDQVEWLETYWWISKIAEDRVALGGSGYRHTWAEAWAAFAKAMILVLVHEEAGLREDERKEALAKARFSSRYKWACTKPYCGDGGFRRALHCDFHRDTSDLRATTATEKIASAEKGFTGAAAHFRSLKRYKSKPTLPLGAREAEREMLMWLTETANHNQLKLTQLPCEQSVKWLIKDNVEGQFRFWCPAVV